MRRVTIVAMVLAAPAVVHAQHDNREFDHLVRQAMAAYDAHDAPGAVAALQRAYAIRPVPRLLFNLGRAHELAEDYATAAQYYQRFLASSPDRQAAAVAQEALDIATRRAAQQAAERQQRTAAEEAARQQTMLAAQQQQQAEEDRRRLAVPVVVTHPRRITLPVAIAGGVAGVGLVAGGVLGGLALSAQSSFNANHAGDSRFDASNRGSAMAIGADVAFGTAVVAGVVGLVLFLTQPTTEPAQ